MAEFQITPIGHPGRNRVLVFTRFPGEDIVLVSFGGEENIPFYASELVAALTDSLADEVEVKQVQAVEPIAESPAESEEEE